jgi:RNA polymerase sigma factor (sigma-70 family)
LVRIEHAADGAPRTSKHVTKRLSAVNRQDPTERQEEVTAFGRAYETEFPRVYSYVRYRVRNTETAEDLTSQVFLKSLDRFSTYEAAKGEIRTWLLGIARNVVRDYFRTLRRWKWVPIAYFQDQASGEPTPEQHTMTGQQRERVLAALAQLSERERDVLGLKFAGGLTNRTIAQLTGLGESHVGVIVYRAIGKLRSVLSDERSGMREKQGAMLFECELARVLPHTVRAEQPSQELAGRLRVAERLIALDLVQESRIRGSLRTKLLETLEERRSGRAVPYAPAQPWSPLTARPGLAIAIGAAAVLALFVGLAPHTAAAVVQPIVRVLESFWVGEHTEVSRYAPQSAADVAAILSRARQQLEDGQRWHLSTPYGGFGGRVPRGEKAIIQRVSSLQLLRSLTPMRLELPTVHRGGSAPFEYAYVAPGGPVFMFFGLGRNELLLSELPVGDDHSAGVGRAVTSANGGTESPPLSVEELWISGQKLVWDPAPGDRDGSALRWEADGISYSLAGSSLTRDEAEGIYRSLRTLDPLR